MNPFYVSVVPCEDYDDARVEKALREVLESIDGLDFVQPGMTVGVKVNLVTALRPETAATVHPSVVCALVRLLSEKGAVVVLGDSPGGPFAAPYLKVVYEVCGMRKAEAFGAKLNDDFSTAEVSFPEAAKAKTFPYTTWLGKVDAIIDLCKLKTHAMMGLTCAVKNFFGSIPGTQKPDFHHRYPRATDFANVLVDLYEYSAPQLCICDAVIGMEGNGPTMGDPRKIGCLLASKNGHALDAVAAKLIGLRPQDIPTLNAAIERGLLSENTDEILVSGNLSQFRVPDFKTVPAQATVFFKVFGDGIPGKIADFVSARVLTPFPKLDPTACVGCGKCAQVCPAKAITMRKNKPDIDRGICIHCFCCQEFCPKGAMRQGTHTIIKIFGRRHTPR